MKIDWKIFNIFTIFLIGIIIVFHLILPSLMMKSFYALEDNQTVKIQENIRKEISQQVDFVEGIARTISLSVNKENGSTEEESRDFFEEKLNNKELEDLRINFLAVVSLEREIVYNQGFDSENNETIILSEKEINKLVKSYNQLKRLSGLIDSNSEVLAVSIYFNGDYYIIVGKVVDLQAANSVYLGDQYSIGKNNGILKNQKNVVDKSNRDYVDSYFLYSDIYGNDTFVANARIAREIYEIGDSQLEILFYFLFLSQVFTITLIIFLVKKIITERLKKLIDSIQTKGKNSKDDIITFKGDDEISILSVEASNVFKKIEQAKKETEYKQSQLDSILVSMHDSVFIFDRNNKLGSAYICDEKEKNCKLEKHILPAEVIRKIVQAIKEIKNGKRLVSINYSITKDGKKMWYDANVSEKRDENGTFDGVIVVARDVTESRNMEKGIQEKLLELEGLNKLMIGRELKMIELKKKIKDIEKK